MKYSWLSTPTNASGVEKLPGNLADVPTFPFPNQQRKATTMASDTNSEDEARRVPGIPGMTVNDDATIARDTPDEPAEDEDADDPDAPFDSEDGPLAVEDDDTIGVSEADDEERSTGSTEAARSSGETLS